MIALRVLAVAVGAFLVIWVFDAAIRNFMLPRSSRVRLTAWIGRTVARVLSIVAPPSRSYAWRDKVQAIRPALTLIAFQAVWLFIIFGGFSMMFWGFGVRPGLAIQESGSALFTLGFATPSHSALLFLVYGEAVFGLTLLALLISYLPTIYGAFQRREFMVAKLANRAGSPPAPWRALAIAHVTNSMSLLDETTWIEWENWFIELSESHTSLTILSFYRSPEPDNHWVSSARSVLDLAALRISVVDVPSGVAPHIMLRSGAIALRTLARHFGIDHDADPRPDDPISIDRSEFDDVWRYLESSGVPLVSDKEQAWRDFAGWRVNYDSIIEAAARAFDTPPDTWRHVEATAPFANS
jgi:hypothetical protein